MKHLFIIFNFMLFFKDKYYIMPTCILKIFLFDNTHKTLKNKNKEKKCVYVHYLLNYSSLLIQLQIKKIVFLNFWEDLYIYTAKINNFFLF